MSNGGRCREPGIYKPGSTLALTLRLQMYFLNFLKFTTWQKARKQLNAKQSCKIAKGGKLPSTLQVLGKC